MTYFAMYSCMPFLCSVCTDFVGHRLCLCVLMCTPYDKTTAWQMVASRHRGVIYLLVHPTKKKVHEYLKRRKDNCYVDRMTYWGIKFRRIMSTTEPWVASEEGDVVREGDSYNTVLRGQIGMHTFVISGEVKAVDPSVECEPGSTASYVDFKTNRVFSDGSHHLNFHRHKLLSWWANRVLEAYQKDCVVFEMTMALSGTSRSLM
ncbi:decapping and exoribonuclease protein-like [Rhipicephalus microplus]|uniref:decapping and exoribonuclease protein-like n=1 Tax=Rhipicephalus microplus TaxID=6941 RepID=UPI003F6B6194